MRRRERGTSKDNFVAESGTDVQYRSIFILSFYLATAFPVGFGGVDCFWKPCPSDKFRSHVVSSGIRYYSGFFSTVVRLSFIYNLLT